MFSTRKVGGRLAGAGALARPGGNDGQLTAQRLDRAFPGPTLRVVRRDDERDRRERVDDLVPSHGVGHAETEAQYDLDAEADRLGGRLDLEVATRAR
jgi:hypothetical protein